ncbi:HAMP domain-containing histidine kinase [Planctomonas sp. JC2975]|nr:HAMP domain-containing sensor histidine kinase [Planctomonas sp. JC2975]NNC13928.1 HAMP domain-containing histidine kinase [Planctomonas sp. JC2975]
MPWRRVTLRTKLVIAVVSLVAVLGVVISLVGALFFRDYQVNKLDEQLDQAARRGYFVALQAVNQPGGVSGKQLAGAAATAPGLSAGTVVAVVTNDGTTYSVYLSRDPRATQQSASPDANARIAALPADGTYTDVDLGGTLGDYRMVSVQLPNSGALVVGLPLADVNAATTRLLTIILLVTVVGIAIAGGLGLLIVFVALRPLGRVAATATAVSRLELDKGDVALAVRVPEADTDEHTEVGRLGAAFNNMLGHVASALTARQASENKVRQFVADASHELRTPLASIRGYAELTRRAPEPLPEDAVHSLGRIESEAERMTALVEDLLLLARLDEGRELDHEPVDLSRLVIDAVSDAHAAGRDHRWSMDLPSEPVTVLGDGPRLYEVIANLLTNARVHTPEGTNVATELSVDRTPDDGSGIPQAVVTVTDDGPGIPDDLQPTLFERFARGDSSRSRHTGSTGLGLAIVRAVAVAQGGSVEVDSEPGRTCFTVRLPLDESTPVTDEAPEIDVPEDEVSEGEVSEAEGPEAEKPQVDVPEANGPETEVSEAEVPEVEVPEIESRATDRSAAGASDEVSEFTERGSVAP